MRPVSWLAPTAPPLSRTHCTPNARRWAITGASLLLIGGIIFPEHTASAQSHVYFNDGGKHSIDDDTYDGYVVHVRNQGCPSNPNPCGSPGKPTKLTIRGTAAIYSADVMDSSTLVLSGDASIADDLTGKGNSKLILNEYATVGEYCRIQDSTEFTLDGVGASCRTLYQIGSGKITIASGSIATECRISGDAALSGGTCLGLSAWGSATVRLMGTTVVQNLKVVENSNVIWTGGTVGFRLSVFDDAHLEIHGSDFGYKPLSWGVNWYPTAAAVGNLLFENGRLEGRLANGDGFENEYSANVTADSATTGSGTIELVPSSASSPLDVPFDITDMSPRLVRIEFEHNQDPRVVGSAPEAYWDPRLTLYGNWVSDGATGLIAISGGDLGDWVFLRHAIGASDGSFSDLAIELDIATGHLTASFEGAATVITIANDAPVYSAVSTLPGPWSGDIQNEYPGDVAGFNLYDPDADIAVPLFPFCSDSFSTIGGKGDCGTDNPASPSVSTSTYDGATGLVNAIGVMEIAGSPYFEASFDLRLTEVDIELGAPFDISDTTPRLIAIETEDSADPSVVGSDAAAIWSPPIFSYWHGGNSARIYVAGSYLERALSERGLDPIPRSFSDTFTRIDTFYKEINHTGGTGSFVGGSSYRRHDTTLGVFSWDAFDYPGTVAGFIEIPDQSSPNGTIYLFCTENPAMPSDAYNPLGQVGGCSVASGPPTPLPNETVDAYPYDPATGLVNATGGIELLGDPEVTLYSRLGDQRWSEVIISIPEPGSFFLQCAALLTLLGLGRHRSSREGLDPTSR